MPEPYNEFTRPQNLAKNAERRALLKEHPELRIRVNTKKLREIIDFADFRCDINCSVARDEAITGSDIDNGTVYTSRPTIKEQEIIFVQELRNQGFTAYHPQEYQTFLDEYNSLLLEDKLSLVAELTKRQLSQIQFITLQGSQTRMLIMGKSII